jgi:hypothetical protein
MFPAANSVKNSFFTPHGGDALASGSHLVYARLQNLSFLI